MTQLVDSTPHGSTTTIAMASRGLRVALTPIAIVFGMLSLVALGAELPVTLAASAGLLGGWLLRPATNASIGAVDDQPDTASDDRRALAPAANKDLSRHSLRRRDRRIRDLKILLRMARAAHEALDSQQRAKVQSQAEVIAGLEELLLSAPQSCAADAAASRVESLEQDLAATNAIVESLSDEVDHWRRRAVHRAA